MRDTTNPCCEKPYCDFTQTTPPIPPTGPTQHPPTGPTQHPPTGPTQHPPTGPTQHPPTPSVGPTSIPKPSEYQGSSSWSCVTHNTAFVFSRKMHGLKVAEVCLYLSARVCICVLWMLLLLLLFCCCCCWWWWFVCVCVYSVCSYLGGGGGDGGLCMCVFC